MLAASICTSTEAGEVFLIQIKYFGEIFEAPMHIRDHHMAQEGNLGMRRINIPGVF
jgi:hypothetical protein